MRVVCHLRRLRGDRKLRDLARAADVHPGDLSRIERGALLPGDELIERLEETYGAAADEWYEPVVLLAIQRDDGLS